MPQWFSFSTKLTRVSTLAAGRSPPCLCVPAHVGMCGWVGFVLLSAPALQDHLPSHPSPSARLSPAPSSSGVDFPLLQPRPQAGLLSSSRTSRSVAGRYPSPLGAAELLPLPVTPRRSRCGGEGAKAGCCKVLAWLCPRDRGLAAPSRAPAQPASGRAPLTKGRNLPVHAGPS